MIRVINNKTYEIIFETDVINEAFEKMREMNENSNSNNFSISTWICA